MLSVNDLMQALDITRVGENKAARKVVSGDAIEEKLLSVLGSEPLHVGVICSCAYGVERNCTPGWWYELRRCA